MKERVLLYDYIRIFAMLLVVSCHCFGDTSTTSSSVISLLTYLEMPCNGLFFAISGTLLLPVSNAIGGGEFLRKRLTKIVIPTIFWSIVYLILANQLSVVNLLSMPFHPVGAGIFWFVYTLIGLYLIAPVISPWLEKVNKRMLEFYLLLWIISMCYPIFNNWIKVDASTSGLLYYFSGFLGYFILGFYLKQYKLSLRYVAIAYIIMFAIMIAVKLFANEVRLYDVFWNLTPFALVGVVFYWRIIEKLISYITHTPTILNIITRISNLTFGVYFIHYAVIKYVTPHISFLNTGNYLCGYTLRIIFAFMVALALSYLISFLPCASYIIGYKQKKT